MAEHWCLANAPFGAHVHRQSQKRIDAQDGCEQCGESSRRDRVIVIEGMSHRSVFEVVRISRLVCRYGERTFG